MAPTLLIAAFTLQPPRTSRRTLTTSILDRSNLDGGYQREPFLLGKMVIQPSRALPLGMMVALCTPRGPSSFPSPPRTPIAVNAKHPSAL